MVDRSFIPLSLPLLCMGPYLGILVFCLVCTVDPHPAREAFIFDFERVAGVLRKGRVPSVHDVRVTLEMLRVDIIPVVQVVFSSY